MTVYRYDRTLKVGRKKTSHTLLATIIIVLAIGLAAYFLLNRNNDSRVVEGREVQVSNDPFLVFTSEYFKFTASKSWAEAAELGNNTDTFVYRKYKSTTPLGVLTIRVNAGSPNLTTNVVPIRLQEGKIAEIGSPSEHCSNSVPASSNLDPQNVVVEEVAFRCWTDGTTYISSAGERGGDLELLLLRPIGETATYSLSYQSTSFETDDKAILEVLKTFETR